MTAFKDSLDREMPGAFDRYDYSETAIKAAAALALHDLFHSGFAAVDISPGDATRYRFIIVKPPTWREPVLAVPGAGSMLLPRDLTVHSDYMLSKMPECHPFTAAFIAAFMRQMVARPEERSC